MKKITMILLLTFVSLSAFSQTFLRPGKTNQERNLVIHRPAEGYQVCQANQVLIYKKFRQTLDKQILQVFNDISKESQNDASSHRLKLYNSLLLDTILQQILVHQLEKQLVMKPLSARYLSAKKPNAGPMLVIDDMKVEIDKEISQILGKVLTAKKIKEKTLKWIEDEIYKEILGHLVKGTFKIMLSEQTPELILAAAAGAVSKEAIKKTLIQTGVHISKDILVSLGRGTLYELLTYPLHAYALPPETEWMDVLKEIPELILNPDWSLVDSKNKSGQGLQSIQAWQTHCLAMVRITDRVEHRYGMLEKKVNQNFLRALKFIKSSDGWDYSGLEEVKVDNTYVSKPRLLNIPK